MCLYPKLIQNPKYKPNKKNNYNPPILKDERIALVPIGCGNCIECRKKKAREWQVRLNEEIRMNKNGQFITLSFSEENLRQLTQKTFERLDGLIPPDKILENEIATTAIRLFLERWRKIYKKSLRHWLITELGHTNTERIHIHGLIFTNESTETINKIWSYGHTYKGDYVNEKTINYIVKYVTKIDTKHKGFNGKIMTSAGIGNNYTMRIDSNNNKYNGNKTNEFYKTRTGTKLALPIYYRNKLYTEEERENLWLNKLDKNERWVMGEKINIEKSEDDYYKLLKHYQKINKRLGYGDNTEEWNISAYKEARKLLKRRPTDR